MRMRKKKHCILVMILLILITALACSTPPAKIEAVDPSLTFPYFPDPIDGEGKPIPILTGQDVMVPLWYWKKIAEYVIEVEKTREVYEAWRNIYCDGEN